MENLLNLFSAGSMTEWALESMSVYGVPILIFLTFIGSLGIPFPVTLVIIAAGAFARQGSFPWWQAALACLAGSMLADQSEYILGRFAGHWIKRRFENTLVWQRANTLFHHQGGWMITLTRFWLTPLAPEINLLAGSHYPYAHFMLFDLFGQFLWVLIYGGLGYLFASQWELVSRFVSQFTSLSIGLMVVLGAILLILQRYKKRKNKQSIHQPF